MRRFSDDEAIIIERDWLADDEPSVLDYLPNQRPEATDNGATGNDPCPHDLVIALAAKGFVIMTGPSGTGKSRGGLQLSYAVAPLGGNPKPKSSYALVSVGADWTDGRFLLGFKNPFGKERDVAGLKTNETYEITDTLRLLLAASHPDRQAFPHFLMLDEMNLSHVERYFSSFLSILEANRSAEAGKRLPLVSAPIISLISQVLTDEDATTVESESAKKLAEAGSGLTLPDNLFIIGTVNVDETTYMFSPKVLDRAHVIELGSIAPSKYIDGAGSDTQTTIKGQNTLVILQKAIETRKSANLTTLPPHRMFVDDLKALGIPDDDAEKIFEAIKRLLDGSFTLLEPIGFGFGFRVVNEVFDYLLTWFHAEHSIKEGDASFYAEWETALDKVFLQKVLPKIHGNRRQLGDSLIALRAFLEGKDDSTPDGARYKIGDSPQVGVPQKNALLLNSTNPMEGSRAKISRMNRRLVAVGYATFVE